MATFRNRDVAAIEQDPFAADAAHAAPGPRAHERPEPVLAEVVREDIAVRGGVVIDAGRSSAR